MLRHSGNPEQAGMPSRVTETVRSSERLGVSGRGIKPQYPDFAALPQSPDKPAVGVVQEADRVIEDLFTDQVQTCELEAHPRVPGTVMGEPAIAFDVRLDQDQVG